MNSYRGGVGLGAIGPPPLAPIEDTTARTRCGYPPNEVVQSLQKALQETGAYSTGRAFHFAADLICSGGIQVFIRLLWDYALLHVGIASPRIFVYLRQRIQDIDAFLKKYPEDVLFGSEEFQIRVGEILLVLRETPRRSIVPWPKVGPETHDEGWLRGAITEIVTETAVVRKVWRPEGDLGILRAAGSQLCRALSEGSTERALFWIKWLLEEEVATRKARKGAALSTVERGPATLSSKQRTDVSFFILELFCETYAELAAKGLVRMHEEFQTLTELWRNSPKGLSAGAKKQILVIIVQILAEVPRWKVPAATALIQDPVFISRAIKQVPKFFKEVLAYDAPKQPHLLRKLFKSRGTPAAPKPKGGDLVDDKATALDRALAEYFGGAL